MADEERRQKYALELINAGKSAADATDEVDKNKIDPESILSKDYEPNLGDLSVKDSSKKEEKQ